jgi:hypothetical protein
MSIGSYTRYISNPAEIDPLNQRVRDFLDDSMPDGPENAPAEEVRAWAEHFQRADTNAIAQRENADAFLAVHPEFLDTKANGETMNRTLETLYGDRVYTVSEFEKAYRVCCANKSLALDKAEIAKQEQAAADERANAAREQRAQETRTFTEDEKYTMSLDELRQLENREIQKRMQQAGERGGNGW